MQKGNKVITVFLIILIIVNIFNACARYEFPEIDPAEPIGLVSEEPWEDYAIKTDNIKDWIPAGVYTVGTDIPPGEYFLVPTDYEEGANLKVIKLDENGSSKNGETEQVLGFYNFCFLTVPDGRQLEFIDAKMISSDQAPEITDVNGFYGPGVYRVGKDIPAGEYFFEADPTKDVLWEVKVNVQKEYSNFPIDSYISILKTTFAYGTVKDGEYLVVCHARFSSSEREHKIVSNNGVYPSGHYLVGRDIPAGKYIVQADAAMEMGYYLIFRISRDNSNEELINRLTDDNSADPINMIASRLFKRRATVNVRDGQYLLVQDGSFMKKE